MTYFYPSKTTEYWLWRIAMGIISYPSTEEFRTRWQKTCCLHQQSTHRRGEMFLADRKRSTCHCWFPFSSFQQDVLAEDHVLLHVSCCTESKDTTGNVERCDIANHVISQTWFTKSWPSSERSGTTNSEQRKKVNDSLKCLQHFVRKQLHRPMKAIKGSWR